MANKFNLIKNKVSVQFTDESILFLKLINNKSIFKFDRDMRSFKKWEFHIFDHKATLFEEKTVEKFRNKFIKLF